MKITKMHGTGNDFVVINAMAEKLPADLVAFSKKIADRHYGVGCDQVLLIDKSNIADFKMLIFNNDGSQVEMCGNGIRCLARYVYEKGLTKKKKITVETLAGIKIPEIIGDKVRVNMGKPSFVSKDWKSGETISKPLTIEDQTFTATLVSVGNPHCVIFVDKITDELVHKYGPKIENNRELFPNRINVEFIKKISQNEIEMRVWERGAGETLACGTGSTAAAIAAIKNGFTKSNVIVHLIGGNLEISWDGSDAFMTGPAEFVFEAEISYK